MELEEFQPAVNTRANYYHFSMKTFRNNGNDGMMIDGNLAIEIDYTRRFSTFLSFEVFHALDERDMSSSPILACSRLILPRPQISSLGFQPSGPFAGCHARSELPLINTTPLLRWHLHRNPCGAFNEHCRLSFLLPLAITNQ